MYRLKNNITDYDIQALIDNELDWETEKHVRSVINQSPALSNRYNELLNQKEVIQKWFSSKKSNA